jgi:hypothetical protein
MLAVHEPFFQMPRPINIHAILKSHYVPSRVGRAALKPSALSPVHIDELEFMQEVVGELLKFCVGNVTKTEVWHLGTSNGADFTTNLV